MSRTFAIGDIHGGLKALEQVLEKAQVTPKDKLIFLGDYVDGWSQSPQVLDFLIALNSTHNCVFIRGNHDDLLLKWFKEKTHNDMWFHHGGEATVNAYKNISTENIEQHIAFLETLENYHLDKKNRLFVHAGFTNLNGVEYEYFPKMFYWERTLWETALALDPNMDTKNLRYPKRLTLYEEIYIGHTPVTRIEETTPVQMANVWNVDTGAAFKGPLTIINVDTKEFWQSEPLYKIYKKEKGRN
ncbi:serine/threonine protein phosphatase 1 [Flavobacterium arsenatis]|uniref:Serine/threonine protein phosphatase 1 n=1 Tax=Flavobacterium arsenatis TaxID=1484332 RepID=A0ABU1TSW0_9FLAO|nr:metallophosphoesterase family protein [Flavobacterium arsenatis]MDR6968970.1 serine/threonine protein phosphatase 1 [Flavobacterium arsenatis]